MLASKVGAPSGGFTFFNIRERSGIIQPGRWRSAPTEPPRPCAEAIALHETHEGVPAALRRDSHAWELDGGFAAVDCSASRAVVSCTAPDFLDSFFDYRHAAAPSTTGSHTKHFVL